MFGIRGVALVKLQTHCRQPSSQQHVALDALPEGRPGAGVPRAAGAQHLHLRLRAEAVYQTLVFG